MNDSPGSRDNGRGDLRAKATRSPAAEVRVLLPVWGTAYVDQFLAVGLPSLLAPGNLPALSVTRPTRFVLLAPRSDAQRVVRDRRWAALSKIVTAEVVEIGDLISASASTVLTLAYARALRSAESLTETVFIFLVADYVVADGTLSNLHTRIGNGASAVLTANLSATSEAAIPALARQIAGDVLTIAPRELMRVALDHLHPLMTAGLATGQSRHDPDANRVFWRVDADTLVGRHYLLHMAAIRPEVGSFTIAAPSDYALVEELAPSGRVDIISDSDDFAVIEAVRGTSALGSMANGGLSPKAVGGSARRWATAAQRSHAKTAIIFHAGDLPNLDVALTASGHFVDEVAALLPPDSHPVRHHPYWIGQLDHHRRTLLDATGASAIPPLLGYDPSSASFGRYPIGELRSKLLGYMPDVRPWHPRWPDVVALRGVLHEGTGRALIVGDHPEALRRIMPGAAVMSVAELDAAEGRRGTYDRGFLVLTDAAKARREALSARMWALLGPAATLAVSTGNVFSDDVSRITAHPDQGRGVALGPVRAAVQSAMMRGAADMGRKSGIALAAALPPLALLAFASLILNLVAIVVPARPRTPCSSAIAVLCNPRAEAANQRGIRASRSKTLPPTSPTPLLRGGPAQ